jgi:hypothetical protein
MYREMASVRTYHPERNSHQRSLAGAILAEERVYSSGPNGEACQVQRSDRSEAFDDIDERNCGRRRLHSRVSHGIVALPCCWLRAP